MNQTTGVWAHEMNLLNIKINKQSVCPTMWLL
jgi:hypothetical protein